MKLRTFTLKIIRHATDVLVRQNIIILLAVKTLMNVD